MSVSVEKQIRNLREEIREHDRRYYLEANPSISDKDYDRLYRQLRDLEAAHPELITRDSPTQRVSEMPLPGFETVAHRTPMLSLDNTYSEQEVSDFFRRLERLLPSTKITAVIEPKVDGVAISVFYQNGELLYAATRGNGTMGDEVTQNVRTIRSVPLRLPNGAGRAVEIRGEIYLGKDDFKRLNLAREQAGEATFVNPRNAAAGSLKQLDSRLVAERRLSALFYGFGLTEDLLVATQQEALGLLRAWGVPTHRRVWTAESVGEVIAAIKELGTLRNGFPFEMDGAVVKVDRFDLREQVGFTSKAPRWAIAFKYEAERAETTILSIEVNVGRSGKLTPVANLEPVFVSGTTVARATLHNGEEIRRKDVRIGDRVLVEKSGEIIPAVVAVLKEKRNGREQIFEMPERCPSCGGPVVRAADQVDLRCLNIECPEQVRRRLEHFAHKGAMDIDGLGEAMLEQLVGQGLVRRVDHIYDLNADQLGSLPRMGAKSVSNLLTGIAESKKRPLWRLIFGLGILHVGATAARELAQAFGTLDNLAQASMQDLLSVQNTGEVVARSINDWFCNKDNRALIEALRQHGLNFGAAETVRPQSAKLAGTVWVITGTLSQPRDEIAEIIRRNGGRISSSISTKTSFLLAGAESGSKLDKAKQLKVKVVGEEEFRGMLG
jgi:DNA ligase (NAD+)